MAHDALRNTPVTRAFSDVLTDLSDLISKELRLAKAEMADKIATKLQGSVWVAIAGLFGLVVLLLLVEAAVFAVASFGFALHWACLLVAGALALIAVGAFLYGRLAAGADITPSRTINQITNDINTVKEQLS
jgi:Putative Actinobacterial Holin-X, holin superfamily III